MWEKVVSEHLREFSYMADCASMNFGMNVIFDNISFSWSGFNDKIPVYIIDTLKKILEMKDCDLEHIFNNVKEK